jgi:hypothetical protein
VHRYDAAGFEDQHKTQRRSCRDGVPSLSAHLVLNEAA